jgi:hypothetical protein
MAQKLIRIAEKILQSLCQLMWHNWRKKRKLNQAPRNCSQRKTRLPRDKQTSIPSRISKIMHISRFTTISTSISTIIVIHISFCPFFVRPDMWGPPVRALFLFLSLPCRRDSRPSRLSWTAGVTVVASPQSTAATGVKEVRGGVTWPRRLWEHAREQCGLTAPRIRCPLG